VYLIKGRVEKLLCFVPVSFICPTDIGAYCSEHVRPHIFYRIFRILHADSHDFGGVSRGDGSTKR